MIVATWRWDPFYIYDPLIWMPYDSDVDWFFDCLRVVQYAP